MKYMPAHPWMRGLSNRRRRQVLEHLEASESAAHLVMISDTDQLRDLLLAEISKEQNRNGGEGGNLGLVLAALGELSTRTLGMRPHPGQITVAAALCEGHLVEYPTGEGKTLAAALAAVWLSGVHGTVHVATANDYLAVTGRDTMRPLFDSIGLSSSVVTDGASFEERRDAYQQRIVYGTLNTFATDFLADHLVTKPEKLVEPRHAAVIVDEADALLVDNATVPFVLAGTTRIPVKLDRFVETARSMQVGVHYEIDEARRSVWLTSEGVRAAETGLGVSELYRHPVQVQWLHAALSVAGGEDQAGRLYREGTHYLVESGSVYVIDQQGRAHANRRFTGGLHPVLESHLGLSPSKLPVPVARTSTRSFVSQYHHLCGTAGTLVNDAAELESVYGKDVLVVGPNVPSRRIDHPDRVYATSAAKMQAIAAEILRRHRVGQPVLVGTSSVSDAENLSALLRDAGVDHNLLTARDHGAEAELIAEAGAAGAVTITAKRAGRGVDIILGGSDGATRQQVIEAGGLVVIAAERFDSRRADMQLRGRCARQGDPGETLTFVSCEDDLVRVFAGAKLDAVLRNTPSTADHEDLRVPGLGAMIDRAQTQLEQMNADIRRSMLPTDTLRSEHTDLFYHWRQQLLSGRDLRGGITSLYEENIPSSRRFRRKVRKNPSLLEPFWPAGRTLPTMSDPAMFAGALADLAWEDLLGRMAPQNGITRDAVVAATSDALVSAILEIADAEWSSYLTALTALEAASESSPAAMNASIEVAFQDFRRQLAERVMQVIWRAGFTVSDRTSKGDEGPAGS